MCMLHFQVVLPILALPIEETYCATNEEGHVSSLFVLGALSNLLSINSRTPSHKHGMNLVNIARKGTETTRCQLRPRKSLSERMPYGPRHVYKVSDQVLVYR